jgi:chitodextrinase
MGKGSAVRKVLAGVFSLSLVLSSVGVGAVSAAVPSLPWLSGYMPRTQADETMISDFENWRGKRVDISQTFIGGTYKNTWAGMTTNPEALQTNGTVATLYSNNRLTTLAIPLLAGEDEGDFAGLAGGDYDSYHQTIATKLYNIVGSQTIYIRLGWEANRGYPWSYEDHGGTSIASDYKTGWARIANIYKNTLPGVKMVWNNLRTFGLPITTFYPGNSVVDVLSMDPYDNGAQTLSSGKFADSAANWNVFCGSYNSSTGTLSGPCGLLAYAQSLGKKVAIDEWGPSNLTDTAGDGSNNAYYVNAMYDWFSANRDDIEYETYFGGAVPEHQIYPRITELGNASDSYLAAYSSAIGSIKKTLDSLTVDGDLTESVWDISTEVNKTIVGTPNNTVTFGTLWDDTYLYVGVKALDSSLKNDSTALKDDDSFDIYIDADHNQGTIYDSHDRQFQVGYNDSTLSEKNGNTTGVLHATTGITGGFSAELAIPWSNLGITPSSSTIIGLDIANNDDDDGGTRDSQTIWNGTSTDWQDTSSFGEADLSATTVGGDIQAPTAPTNVNAVSKTHDTVDLSWTASTDNVGVVNYNILRDGVYTGSSGGGTTYTDTGLTAGTTYSYTVRAKDAANNFSSPSTALNVTTVPATTLVSAKTGNTVTIDGNLNEADWDVSTNATKTILGTPNNTATFGTMWDSTYLYIGMKALDSSLKNDSTLLKDDDSFDIYIDADHNQGTTYDSYDRQFQIGYNDSTLFEKNGNTSGVLHATTTITGGFSAELAIPWSNLGVTPSAGMTIGFDIANNDDDNGGTRDNQLIWFGTSTDWQDTSNFGDAVLAN